MANIFKFQAYTLNDEDCVRKAEQEGEALWQWAWAEEYKKLSKLELQQQMDEFGTHLEIAGKRSNLRFVKLVRDQAENMPGDCRVGFFYEPTYVAACVYIHAFNKHPELFGSGRYREWLLWILEACTGRKLRGHGYEAASDFKKNLELFQKAGVSTFIANAPQGCESFCKLM